MGVVVDLEQRYTNAKGDTRWKATVRELKLGMNDGELTSEVGEPENIKRELCREKEVLAQQLQRVIAHLRGATLEIVQRKDGQIAKVGNASLLQNARIGLQKVPNERRDEVRLQLDRILEANAWKTLLSAQAPRFSTSRTVGKRWNYAPEPFMSFEFLKPAVGSSQIKSLQGDGNTAQVNVTSMAKVDFEARDGDALADFVGKHTLGLHSTIVAQTRFGKQHCWPLEHFAAERGRLMFKTWGEDDAKQGSAEFIAITTSDFQIQTRLVVRPIDEPAR